MTRGRIIAGIVVLVVIAAIVGGVLYSSSASAPAVTTAKVTRQTLGVTVTASGKLEGSRRSDVYPRSAGTLATVEVSEGATVAAGDTLAVMDTAPLKAQVASAESALASARSQQDAVTRGVPSAIDRAAASSGVTAASAAYDAARSAYEAYLALHPAATPSSDATLASLDISRLQAASALAQARSGVSKLSAAAKVSAAKAAAASGVAAASSALSLARSNLDAATITAPISGVVVFNPLGTPGGDGSFPKAEAGSAVAPGSAIFTVIDLSALVFDAQVDEADVSRLLAGQRARITLDAFADTTFEGAVTAIRPTAIQTTTGGVAFPVLMSVDAAGSRLLVGMSGSADIRVESVASALTVPIEAVIDESGHKYVYVLGAGNKVTRTEVGVGALTDVTAQITSGLTDGQTVVTSQLTSLKDGTTVRPQ